MQCFVFFSWRILVYMYPAVNLATIGIRNNNCIIQITQLCVIYMIYNIGIYWFCVTSWWCYFAFPVSLDPSFSFHSSACVFAIAVLFITLFINVNILYLYKMYLLNLDWSLLCERLVIMNLSHYLHLKINENKYVCIRKSDGVIFSPFYI